MQNANNNTHAALTSFNRDIQVTVSVDQIAANLLGKMDKENPHAVLIVNTIMGQALANERMGDISRIYNAMNGWEDKLDLKVGQKLFCNDTTYDYMFKPDGSRHEIGPCRIVEINPLKDISKVNIEYTHFEKDRGVIKMVQRTMWVNHKGFRELTQGDFDQFDDAVRLAIPEPVEQEATLD